MLKTLIQLLGTDAPIFRRYSWMAVLYGLLCGLTMTTLVPVFTHLLNGEPKQAGGWLLPLKAAVRKAEKIVEGSEVEARLMLAS